MQEISDEQFQELIDRAFDSLPKEHRDRVQNVAMLIADEPSAEQRQAANLRPNETLLGLYEGVPLAQRQGRTSLYPDRITLFKLPLLRRAHGNGDLYEAIRHTLWHEIAHYYGLNHDQIHELE